MLYPSYLVLKLPLVFEINIKYVLLLLFKCWSDSIEIPVGNAKAVQ